MTEKKPDDLKELLQAFQERHRKLLSEEVTEGMALLVAIANGEDPKIGKRHDGLKTAALFIQKQASLIDNEGDIQFRNRLLEKLEENGCDKEILQCLRRFFFPDKEKRKKRLDRYVPAFYTQQEDCDTETLDTLVKISLDKHAFDRLFLSKQRSSRTKRSLRICFEYYSKKRCWQRLTR